MTQSEWESCTSPVEMLRAVRAVVNPGALRWVVCGLAALNDWSDGPKYTSAPWMTEALALALGHETGGGRLDAARRAVLHECEVTPSLDPLGDNEGRYCAAFYWFATLDADPVTAFAYAAGRYRDLLADPTYRMLLVSGGRVFRRPEPERECDLIWEVLGDPFRPPRFDPAWLTPDVLLLAEGINSELAYGRMPLLADALRGAGCGDERILTHCRQVEKPHHLDCWVLTEMIASGNYPGRRLLKQKYTR